MKENTENHLKLACEKLQEFEVLSAVNTANVKELEAEMVTAKKKIAELSEAVQKTNGLQGMIYNKIALTDEKLNEVPEKDEVDSLIGEVKELQHEKFLEVQDEVSELRIFVNEGLKSLKSAIFKLRHQSVLDLQENIYLQSQIAQISDETHRDKMLLHECRDKLTAYQEWWRKAKFVLFCTFFLVVFLLLSLQSHKAGNG